MIKWGKLISRIRAGSRICQSGRSGNGGNGGSCSAESGQAAGFANPTGAGTGK